MKHHPQSRSSFLTRAPTDNAAQLSRRSSFTSPKSSRHEAARSSITTDVNTSEIFPGRPSSSPPERANPGLDSRGHGRPNLSSRGSTGGRRKSTQSQHGGLYAAAHRRQGEASASHPAAVAGKLGTFSGVFVPTTLNVLSILMFIRFGFILGQSGFLGMMGKSPRCHSRSVPSEGMEPCSFSTQAC